MDLLPVVMVQQLAPLELLGGELRHIWHSNNCRLVLCIFNVGDFGTSKLFLVLVVAIELLP